MRNILYIILFLAVTAGAQAQSLASVGIVAGGTAATQSWTYASGTSPETGYSIGPAFGIFAEGFRARGISFAAEVWYMQKGLTVTAGASEKKPKLIYISMPLLMRYRFGDDAFGYYVTAGPRIDYLFHIDPQSMTAMTDALSEGESDLGFSAGTGIQFPLGFIPDIHLETRYSASLIPVFKNDLLTVRNSSIDFLLGIGF